MPDPTPNKVRYGLKNVHYATVTFASDGTPTFGTPVAIPGAVSMSLSRTGEIYEFYADDGVYYELGNNAGYDGTIEFALIPDAFRVACLGETLDNKNVLMEEGSPTLGHFALLFEFTGDQNAIRHVLYNCTATQDDVAGQTKGESVEVQTETLNLTAKALPGGGRVKAKTGTNTDATVYSGWYGSVYQTAATT